MENPKFKLETIFEKRQLSSGRYNGICIIDRVEGNKYILGRSRLTEEQILGKLESGEFRKLTK